MFAEEQPQQQPQQQDPPQPQQEPQSPGSPPPSQQARPYLETPERDMRPSDSDAGPVLSRASPAPASPSGLALGLDGPEPSAWRAASSAEPRTEAPDGSARGVPAVELQAEVLAALREELKTQVRAELIAELGLAAQEARARPASPTDQALRLARALRSAGSRPSEGVVPGVVPRGELI